MSRNPCDIECDLLMKEIAREQWGEYLEYQKNVIDPLIPERHRLFRQLYQIERKILGDNLLAFDTLIRELERKKQKAYERFDRKTHKKTTCEKRPIPNSLRKKVLERDAYRCQVCRDWQNLHIDHIIPESRGGSSTEDNLQALCQSCNLKKGAQIT